MIQDISPYEFHNEYTDRAPQPGDTVFVFDGRTVLCREGADENNLFPAVADVPCPASALQYLFRISESCCYLFLPEKPDLSLTEVPGCRFIPLMSLRSKEHTVSAFAAMTAYHLHTWYEKNRYCGRCGSGARLEHDKQERMLRCPTCGNMVFPTIAPAVIVGVTWGEKLLMTKYAGREYGGWALIAGFCEVGETVEDTVHREVMEEAGVQVNNLRYIDSQPWGSDSNLLMGYFCDVDGDPAIHMDAEELSRAQWVDRSEIPDMSDNISLTGYLIELFRKGKEK